VSDLLTAVGDDEHFDLVCFNPPYVPTEVGRRRGHARSEPARVWDGGPDGAAVMRRVLPQFAARLRLERLLLGFNRRFIDQPRLRAAAADCGLAVEDVVTQPLNPSVVYVIGRAGLGGSR
jgi:methylase of polypeptide subunit release factors